MPLENTTEFEITGPVNLVDLADLEADESYRISITGSGGISLAEGGAQAPDSGHPYHAGGEPVPPITIARGKPFWCSPLAVQSTRIVISKDTGG